MKMSKGFTLLEVVVAMAVFSTLIALVTTNLLGAKRKSSLNASLSTFIADMKEQQIKALEGDTEGRVTTDNYGIHFETSSYTLFHGTTYSSGDGTNYVVNLPDTLQFANVTFSGNQILFLKGSGDVSNFISGSNTITFKDSTNNGQETVTINRYGAVTAEN